MKKIINIFLLFLALFTVFSVKANAMNFQQAFSQVGSKPMVVLIYATWADGYQNTLAQYREVKTKFGNTFNFVELDIASKDAKAFNEKYHIYPKLPYILMFRDGGKVSRYISRDCAASSSCTESKLKSFVY